MPSEIIGTLLWILAVGASLFVVVMGLVLAYHWIKFAMNRFAVIAAIAVYFTVSFILLLTLVGAALTYSP